MLGLNLNGVSFSFVGQVRCGENRAAGDGGREEAVADDLGQEVPGNSGPGQSYLNLTGLTALNFLAR